MKNRIFPIMALIMISVVSATAQGSNPEYVKMLNNQSDALKISKKINENKIKLYELEGKLVQETKNSQSTILKAQSSANQNVAAADKLSENVSNKKNAKDAKKSASDAKHDSNKVTDASDDASDLTREIADLKNEIISQQSQLALIPGYPFKD
ncbi:hypothetical protein F0919_00490 [Taibaiella lutea]|uniref:SlyB protein n=1 Tax=Taibaiella lutea TaxID=2608001 RepID=A0A5M6CLS9_9BACT|nr:hypothetical protein [Taibaiella lutea]KAA5536181.1 hypothetical protein F0919_00490 [Taibaiella lutea]